jgi:hypothetical protein
MIESVVLLYLSTKNGWRLAVSGRLAASHPHIYCIRCSITDAYGQTANLEAGMSKISGYIFHGFTALQCLMQRVCHQTTLLELWYSYLASYHSLVLLHSLYFLQCYAALVLRVGSVKDRVARSEITYTAGWNHDDDQSCWMQRNLLMHWSSLV